MAAYPISKAGQAAFFRDLASWAPSAGVSGVRPWAPEVFVPGWQGLALFSPPTGGVSAARPALGAIAEGLASPDPDAFHD